MDTRIALGEHARAFAGLTVADMAEDMLRARGELTIGRPSAGAVIQRAITSTSSDFSSLLADATEKALNEAYNSAPSGIKPAARERSATNFRSLSTIRAGEFPELLEVPEGGEVKHGKSPEMAESFRVNSFARIWSITREALVNDDLGAFADFSRQAGLAAANKEADVFVDLLMSNPTMSDGVAMFATEHANLAAAGAGINLSTMSAARASLRKQKGLDGKSPTNAEPLFLIVSPDRETEAEQVLAEVAASSTADANPFTRRLNLLVEPRLTDGSWFVVADPQQVPSLEYAYLDGNRGPQVVTRPGFEVMGLEVRISLDFGAGLVDWRGMFRNPGT
jgi:phage major head subunit gpT-like protein